MESIKKHFVVVHGVCHGAWCWYKVKSALESKGHKVTALDLAACGINTKQIEQVETFSEYSEPLLELLASLAPKEMVVLVGHSFGGISIAMAMDKFPHKVEFAVFVSAFIPDTIHNPSYVLQKHTERYGNRESDNERSWCGGKTLMMLGPNTLSTMFYQHSSAEDLELAKSLVRRGSLFFEELSKAENFSKEGYGSVECAYVVCSHDLAIPVEFQQWMIQNSGVSEVRQINGADHMVMISKPQELSSCLLALALSALQKCSTVTSLREARQLHALIVTTTTTLLSSKSPFLYNNIISMYARCGSLSDSHILFDKMPHKTLVSYNALLSAYSRAPGHAVSALKLYTQMGFMAVRPSSKTFTSLLQASSLLEDWWVGSLLHAQGIKFGFLSNICVQTSLLNMYSNCGDLGSAEMVFGNIGDRDDVAWNSLIIGYLKNNKIKEGLSLFSAMLRDGFVPTQFTYSMILSACSRLKGYQYGRLIHGHLIVRNVSCDLHMQNALLDMYCNAGDTQTADKFFCGMENPDLVSWNSMIAGYSENEDGKKAMSLFVRLQEFCFPKPDDYTYAGIISATGAFPCSSYGKPLHAQVIKAGLERSVFVGSTLVSMYFKNCEIEAAQRVFDSISRKDVVLWTEIIIGYSKTDGMSAIKCFSEMFHKAQGIDDYVLSAVLSACADLAILRQDPDLKCRNSMLGGYSRHGMVEEAFKLFEEILEQGLIPDQVTFLSLLSACSHCRLVEQGKFLWNYMNSIALVPGPKHYSCMVSLLSRAALLEEAEEIIIKSPYVEDNLELWRTLLSACVINKNLKVGVHAAEEVLKLDANDGPTLVLLSNLYASAGRWDKVAETRRNMKGLLVEKSTGLSWIEAKNNIHAFSSGDQSHPMADEVQAELYRLKINMVGTEIDEHEAQNAYAT
ncbi:hypothetical protein AAHE18_15G056600 [Arachis hypogaea]